MTHEELLAKMATIAHTKDANIARNDYLLALRAVVELCNKWETKGSYCLPIEDVIKVIEGEISDSQLK